MCLETKQIYVIATTQMSAFQTEQMSSVETEQMSAVEKGQMSAAETGQMSSVARTDICFVSTHNVDVSEVLYCGNVTMLKSQKSPPWQCHNVQVSDVSTVAMSQCSRLRDDSVQVSEVSTVQVADRRSGPKSSKMARNGSRMVAGS